MSRTIETTSAPQTITLSGRLDARSAPALWKDALAVLTAHPHSPVLVRADGVDYCDGIGIAMFVDLLRQERSPAAAVTIQGLHGRYQSLLDQFDPADFRRPAVVAHHACLPEEIGRAARDTWRDVEEIVSFVGEAAAALTRSLLAPRTVRWRDVFPMAEQAGANALPIIGLISFLLGVILAFQSAVPMRMFGAEVFVADLLGLSVLRELGPLITAILFAGRTGAAFAAELGTMKVNEEINALTTMGLDPVRFLVVPRMLAAVLVIPFLTAFSDLIALIGGAIVMRGFGIPPVTFFTHMLDMVAIGDFIGGLFKATIFGLLIAGVGCMRGLQTGAGASAVGLSTTRSVVTSLLLLVIVDGAFAVVFTFLGI